MFCQKGEIRQKAFQLLLENRREGYSTRLKKNYTYTCPSPQTYPFQWFWDSCFHAIALSYFDLKQAKKELLSLLSVQEEDGFLPHVIFWGKIGWRKASWVFLEGRQRFPPQYSALIQPPVLAFAVWRVVEKDNDKEFLKETLPKIKKYYLWLFRNRDPDQDRLISLIAPYESGLDYSPAFDPILNLRKPKRPVLVWAARKVEAKNRLRGYNLEKIFAADYFNVEEVMVNSVLAQNLWALSALCLKNKEKEESEKFENLARQVEEAILTKCWSKDGLFYNLYSSKEIMAKVATFISLLPLILKTISREKAETLVKDHLLNPEEFWLPYPVPAVAKNEPAFNPGRGPLWRGPTWMNINWFLVTGLLEHGYKEVAEEIVEKSCFLIQKNGFREYYHPFTGEGEGAYDFGWSTLIVDMIELIENGKEKISPH